MMAALALGGCVEGEELTCGATRTPLVSGDDDPVSRAEARTSGGERIYTWTLEAERACLDQEIPFQASALVLPAQDVLVCDVEPPRVSLKHARVGSLDPPVVESFVPTTGPDGALHFARNGSADLRLAKSEPVFWELTLEMAFAASGARAFDDGCARERVKAIRMNTTYRVYVAPDKDDADDAPRPSAPATPSALPSGGATAAGDPNWTCGAQDSRGLGGSRPFDLPTNETMSRYHEAGLYVFTWYVGAPEACVEGGLKVEAQVKVVPSSDPSKCDPSDPKVWLVVTRGGDSTEVHMTPTPVDGKLVYRVHSELPFDEPPGYVSNWNILLRYGIQPGDVGERDLACAKERLDEFTLSGEFYKPGR